MKELDEDGYDNEEPPRRVLSNKGFSLFIWFNTHPKWMRNHRSWILNNLPDENEFDEDEDD
ncbi:MAG: hypothetical protein ACYDAO_01455 [Thermoplasmataceae archaeon]